MDGAKASSYFMLVRRTVCPMRNGVLHLSACSVAFLAICSTLFVLDHTAAATCSGAGPQVTRGHSMAVIRENERACRPCGCRHPDVSLEEEDEEEDMDGCKRSSRKAPEARPTNGAPVFAGNDALGKATNYSFLQKSGVSEGTSVHSRRSQTTTATALLRRRLISTLPLINVKRTQGSSSAPASLPLDPKVCVTPLSVTHLGSVVEVIRLDFDGTCLKSPDTTELIFQAVLKAAEKRQESRRSRDAPLVRDDPTCISETIARLLANYRDAIGHSFVHCFGYHNAVRINNQESTKFTYDIAKTNSTDATGVCQSNLAGFYRMMKLFGETEYRMINPIISSRVLSGIDPYALHEGGHLEAMFRPEFSKVLAHLLTVTVVILSESASLERTSLDSSSSDTVVERCYHIHRSRNCETRPHLYPPSIAVQQMTLSLYSFVDMLLYASEQRAVVEICVFPYESARQRGISGEVSEGIDATATSPSPPEGSQHQPIKLQPHVFDFGIISHSWSAIVIRSPLRKALFDLLKSRLLDLRRSRESRQTRGRGRGLLSQGDDETSPLSVLGKAVDVAVASMPVASNELVFEKVSLQTCSVCNDEWAANASLYSTPAAPPTALFGADNSTDGSPADGPETSVPHFCSICCSAISPKAPEEHFVSNGNLYAQCYTMEHKAGILREAVQQSKAICIENSTATREKEPEALCPFRAGNGRLKQIDAVGERVISWRDNPKLPESPSGHAQQKLPNGNQEPQTLNNRDSPLGGLEVQPTLHSRKLSVFIGDTYADLGGMLEADIGIVIGNPEERSYRKFAEVCRVFGIIIEPIATLLEWASKKLSSHTDAPSSETPETPQPFLPYEEARLRALAQLRSSNKGGPPDGGLRRPPLLNTQLDYVSYLYHDAQAMNSENFEGPVGEVNIAANLQSPPPVVVYVANHWHLIGQMLWRSLEEV